MKFILCLVLIISGCKDVERTYTFKESKVYEMSETGVYFKDLNNEIHYIKFENFPLMKKANFYIGVPVVIACKQDGVCEYY